MTKDTIFNLLEVIIKDFEGYDLAAKYASLTEFRFLLNDFNDFCKKEDVYGRYAEYTCNLRSNFLDAFAAHLKQEDDSFYRVQLLSDLSRIRNTLNQENS